MRFRSATLMKNEPIFSFSSDSQFTATTPSRPHSLTRQLPRQPRHIITHRSQAYHTYYCTTRHLITRRCYTCYNATSVFAEHMQANHIA